MKFLVSAPEKLQSFAVGLARTSPIIKKGAPKLRHLKTHVTKIPTDERERGIIDRV